MNERQIATRLVRLAKSLIAAKSVDDLDAATKKMVEPMKKKGYTVVVQVVTTEGDFGEPLFFESANDVGPFLRSFPDYQKAKTKWVVNL